MSSRWMTAPQAAEYMGASVTTVKRHLTAGHLRWHVTPGGLKRIDREDVDQLFARVEPERNRGVVTDEEFKRFVRG